MLGGALQTMFKKKKKNFIKLTIPTFLILFFFYTFSNEG